MSVATPAEAAEPARRSPGRVATATAPAAKTASRHISRDYSYVGGELRRIAITMGIIVAGLIVATLLLR